MRPPRRSRRWIAPTCDSPCGSSGSGDTGRSRLSGENAYLEVFAELADLPVAELGSHLDAVILFFNRWNCRLPMRAGETQAALRAWLEQEATALQSLAALSLTDAGVAEHLKECERLYSSLIALRDPAGEARIATMGDAAASKILHLMVPPLFVMWDKEIKKARQGYGEFLLEMHRFALRLRDVLAPEEARGDLEGYLQRVLGYPMKKPLAKYVDEYNWWVIWGVPHDSSRDPLGTVNL
jgi:hypothetical protein